jgi:hypothetical protein
VNPVLTASVVASLGLQSAALVLPPLRRFLGSARLSPVDIGLSTLMGGATIIANELLKNGKEREND